MQILDLVMHAELREQKLKPRHELARKFHRRKRAVAELHFNRRDHDGQFAKHGVARQPEARHLAEIGVAFPLLARVTRDQHAQILRPAVAAGERERLAVVCVGQFDGHWVFLLRMILSENQHPSLIMSRTSFSGSCAT
jgi:hypothetical protein